MAIITEKDLNEKLEPAIKRQFDLLQKQIDSDPETARMLTSPMKDIPQYYWLYSDVTIYAEEHSLFDILKFFVFIEKKATVLFSKVGSIFTGFIAYYDKGKILSGLKIASFYDDKRRSNFMLANDLISFVEKEIHWRSRIEWWVDTENKTALTQYNKLLKQKKFTWSCTPTKTGRNLLYVVTGKKKD